MISWKGEHMAGMQTMHVYASREESGIEREQSGGEHGRERETEPCTGAESIHKRETRLH